MASLFTIEHAELVAPEVAGVVGRERLSEPFAYEVGVVIGDVSDLDLDALLLQTATLRIDAPDEAEATAIHGVVESAELLHAWGGRALLRLTIVPRLEALRRSRHSRTFVDQSVDAVIEAVLADYDLDFELRLQDTYPPRHHIGQYGESDLAFVSRLMEREGMYYLFEHGDGSDKLVIVDATTAHDETLRSAPVHYVPGSEEDASIGQALSRFEHAETVVPGEVVARHYDYRKPDLAVEGAATASEADAAVYLYGEDVLTPDEARRVARLRAEELAVGTSRVKGHGRVFGLAAGYRFSVADHALPDLDGDYLATELRVWANQGADALVRDLLGLPFGDELRVDVVAVAADRPYRAPRRTPTPTMAGLQLATVDGEADSEFGQLDDEGRYSVRLMHDESGADDGKASTRVRMSQPHGGDDEGWHLPLRKGTEVALSFMGGDPDRPLIVGVLPNAHTVSPVTSANHTTNVLQTGGLNRWELQDEKGEEYIDISTPPQDTRIHWGKPHEGHTHYIVDHTDGDCLVDIGATRDIEIGGEQNEFVKGNVTETYKSNQKTVIGGKQEIDVTRNRILDIEGPQKETVKGHVKEDYDTKHEVYITSTLDEKAGPVTERYASQETKVKGHVKETFSDHDVTVKKTRTINAGATTHAYDKVTCTSGPPYTLNGLADATITANSVTIQVGSKKTTDSEESWFTPYSNGYTSTSIELVAGSKNEAVGNVGEIAALKVGLTGLQGAVVGIDISLSGFHLILAGMREDLDGVDNNT